MASVPAVAFTDSSGKLLFNANGNAGVDGAKTWYKYVYLFPDGNASDARINTDATYDHFAIAPIPAYAYFRSYQYNPIYYNPNTTYQPWNPAYISGATRTFSAASTSAARSHPWFPTSGTRDHHQPRRPPVLGGNQLDLPHAAGHDHSGGEHLRHRRAQERRQLERVTTQRRDRRG